MNDLLKVSIAGVRGVVGSSITPQVVSDFAQAFGGFVGRGQVLIGRDTRPSGAMLEQAVVAGLLSVGCRPVRLGVVPTPSLLFLVKDLGALGGIAITASHNPVEWNALKFVDRSGLFLNEDQAQEVFDIYHQHDTRLVDEADIHAIRDLPFAVSRHLDRIAVFVDTESIREKPFRVAVDCINGVGALSSVRFLREYLNVEVVPVFDKPTGVFERDPEPTPENLSALCAAVKEHDCDIGFAQDPDGDRLSVVNEKGEPIGEDLTLGLAVDQMLSAHEPGPVVVNLSTSKRVEALAARHNVPFVRTRIGEVHVARRMLRLGGVVGGENNGGIIVPAIHPCRDSFAGMALILEGMARRGDTVSAWQSEFPDMVLVKDKAQLAGPELPEVLRAVRRHFEGERLDLRDGVYVDFGSSWLHVRASNTEPVLRFMCEAPTAAEADSRLDEVRGILVNHLA